MEMGAQGIPLLVLVLVSKVKLVSESSLYKVYAFRDQLD